MRDNVPLANAVFESTQCSPRNFPGADIFPVNLHSTLTLYGDNSSLTLSKSGENVFTSICDSKRCDSTVSMNS